MVSSRARTDVLSPVGRIGHDGLIQAKQFPDFPARFVAFCGEEWCRAASILAQLSAKNGYGGYVLWLPKENAF